MRRIQVIAAGLICTMMVLACLEPWLKKESGDEISELMEQLELTGELTGSPVCHNPIF